MLPVVGTVLPEEAPVSSAMPSSTFKKNVEPFALAKHPRRIAPPSQNVSASNRYELDLDAIGVFDIERVVFVPAVGVGVLVVV